MTAPDPDKITKDIPTDDSQTGQKPSQPDEESPNNKLPPTNVNKSAINQKTPAPMEESSQATKPGNSSIKPNLTASWLSYGALSDIAVTIAQHLKEKLADSDHVLVSAGDSILTDLRQWLLVHSILSGAQAYCDTVLSQYHEAEVVQVENAGAVLQAGLETGTAILTSLSGLFQLFKTKFTTTQHQIELDNDAIISAIVAQMLVVKPTVVIKSLRSMELRSGLPSDGIQAIGKLMHSRAKATMLAVTQKGSPVKKVELEALAKFIDQIVEHTQLFSGGGLAGSIINGERIHKALGAEHTLLLDLKPIIGGGDQIEIQRSFFHTEEYYINGVAAVSYTLVNSDGKILATGNVHGNTGYKRYDMVNKGIWETSIPSTVQT